MKRLMIAITVAALLVLGALPAMASQWGGGAPISSCQRC